MGGCREGIGWIVAYRTLAFDVGLRKLPSTAELVLLPEPHKGKQNGKDNHDRNERREPPGHLEVGIPPRMTAFSGVREGGMGGDGGMDLPPRLHPVGNPLCVFCSKGIMGVIQ